MKKLTYLSALALGFALVACDNYKEPNPPAQYNPQEPIFVDGDVTSENLINSSTVYNLDVMNQDGQSLSLATVSVDNLAEGYTIGALGYISANKFETQYPVSLSVIENATRADSESSDENMDGESTDTPSESAKTYQVLVSPGDLSAAYREISQSPKEVTLGLRVLLTAVSGDQVAYIGGADNYIINTDITIIPVPSDMEIESAYYLIGAFNDWDVKTALKFEHSDVEDLYEDPIFTIAISISDEELEEALASDDGGWTWKVIPQSTFIAGEWVDASYSQFAPVTINDEDYDGMSGDLQPSILSPSGNYVQPNNGVFKQAGEWVLSINMLDLTFAFEASFTPLYVPGAANGWFGANTPEVTELVQQLTTTDEENYKGYAVLSSEGFKFTSEKGWGGTNYGAGSTPGTLTTDGDAGNLTVSSTGLYWCKVNIAELVYTADLVSTYGIVGGATEGGWDVSTPLTPSEDYLIWTGTVQLTEGEFKFRANNAWDINLGGALDNLTQDGANLMNTEEGTYDVTLNLSSVPYTATLVKK